MLGTWGFAGFGWAFLLLAVTGTTAGAPEPEMATSFQDAIEDGLSQVGIMEDLAPKRQGAYRL